MSGVMLRLNSAQSLGLQDVATGKAASFAYSFSPI